ncbi:hypothetical protein IH824_20065, partial [candidate division KSB1 bacterium]|nr:hypothetical protein [candidate division KSB1 bacterium]
MWYVSKEKKNGLNFEEWAVTQLPIKLQNRYLREIYGIRNGTAVVRQLKDVIEGRELPINNRNIGYLAAFYSEQEQNPEIIGSFTPYQLAKYLTLSHEARLALVTDKKVNKVSPT